MRQSSVPLTLNLYEKAIKSNNVGTAALLGCAKQVVFGPKVGRRSPTLGGGGRPPRAAATNPFGAPMTKQKCEKIIPYRKIIVLLLLVGR